MQIVDSLALMISEHVVKYAFVLNSGSILKSTISEESLLKLLKFLPRICKDLKPGSFIHQTQLYIYRVTSEFIIFFLTEKDTQDVEALINDIENQYSLRIGRKFKAETNNTLGSIMNSIIFSVTTEHGPELMDWIGNTQNSINDKDAYKIAMKAMLNLMDEIEGAKKKVLFFQPFLKYDSLGISYLFQIPFSGARGGSFDSALTILVDFKHRAMIYSLYEELENIIHDHEPHIIARFQNTYKEGACVNSSDFNGLLSPIKQNLDAIKLTLLDTNVLKEDMINAVRELNESQQL